MAEHKLKNISRLCISVGYLPIDFRKPISYTRSCREFREIGTLPVAAETRKNVSAIRPDFMKIKRHVNGEPAEPKQIECGTSSLAATKQTGEPNEVYIVWKHRRISGTVEPKDRPRVVTNDLHVAKATALRKRWHCTSSVRVMSKKTTGRCG